MAAKTPDSIVIENLGSNTLYKCRFSTNDIDDADTYASKITSAIAYWCSPTDLPTQTKEGIDVAYVQSTGTFTFYTGENNRTGDLFILAKS